MKFAHGSRRWLEEPPAREMPGVEVRGDWRADPGTFEGAFRLMYAQVRIGGACAAPGDVLTAVVDARRGELVASGVSSPGDTLLFGRHPACPVRLSGADLSLRHLALFVGEPTPRGLPRLRLWDLKTGVPFIAEDGVPSGAVATEGPLFATVDRFVIAALPLALPGRAGWPADARDGWRLLPRREFVTRVADGTGSHPALVTSADSRTSRVTRLGHTCDLTELCDQVAAVAELTIDCDARRERYYLGPTHLARGVLVGRYSRCLNDVVDDPAVSRVHLLIAAVGQTVYAIDTASSSGSATADGLFDSVALGSHERIAIGDDTVVTWKRYPPRWA